MIITSNNFNEDGNPDFKLTLSIYKNKNKFITQANAPNLKKFIHCYCHTWNNFEIKAEERQSEEDIIKVVGDCIIVPEKMTTSLIYEKEGFTLPEESISNISRKENSNPTESISLTVTNDIVTDKELSGLLKLESQLNQFTSEITEKLKNIPTNVENIRRINAKLDTLESKFKHDMSVVNTRLIDLEEENSELENEIENLQQENKTMKADLKQLNKNKQLTISTIKLEDVQVLINNEKAIISNQSFNVVEKSESKLESSI